jgi:hypothetical protein
MHTDVLSLFIICFLLGNSPASEFYMPTFRNPLLRMEERPPIWRIAVNKLNKQPRTADEGKVLQLGSWARC